MKVSILIFWNLKPSGTCPYQALNHNHYSVENKGGGIRPLLGHPVEATGVCITIDNSEVLFAAVHKSPGWAWSDADIIGLLSFRCKVHFGKWSKC
jgi:hypothetical protein